MYIKLLLLIGNESSPASLQRAASRCCISSHETRWRQSVVSVAARYLQTGLCGPLYTHYLHHNSHCDRRGWWVFAKFSEKADFSHIKTIRGCEVSYEQANIVCLNVTRSRLHSQCRRPISSGGVTWARFSSPNIDRDVRLWAGVSFNLAVRH